MSYINVEKLAPIGRLLVMAVLGMGQRRYPLHSTPLCHEISYRFFLPFQVKLAYDLDGRWRTFLHKNGKHNFKTRLQNYNSVNNLSLFFV